MAELPVTGAQTTRRVLRAGNGPQVNKGQKVTVNCTGSILNPDKTTKKFWSTKDPGQKPFTFAAGVGEVITGWDKGVLDMCLGETSLLTIPGHEGYGPSGFPAWGITPNATLQFEIEVVSAQ